MPESSSEADDLRAELERLRNLVTAQRHEIRRLEAASKRLLEDAGQPFAPTPSRPDSALPDRLSDRERRLVQLSRQARTVPGYQRARSQLISLRHRRRSE